LEKEVGKKGGQEKGNAKVESSDLVQVNTVCDTYSNLQEKRNVKVELSDIV